MASTDSALLSQTILSLTDSKVRELEKQRNAYETRKTDILQTSNSHPDIHERISLLLSAVNELQTESTQDPALTSIRRYLQQAQHDSSIPKKKLEGFEKCLVERLNTRSAKLAMADLYSRLLMEWVDPPVPSDKNANADELDLLADERQKQGLKKLCDTFEAVVFTPVDTNEGDIHAFLNKLFPGEKGAKALEDLRQEIREETTEQWKEDEPFNVTTLSACIRGLTMEDLLSEERQVMLKSLLDNELALNEIADVLNFRYADLKNWDWHAGEGGIPVLPRPQWNGRYRIWMDEDVLQTIFVQYIGVKLCNRFKEVLRRFVETSDLWKWSTRPSMTEHEELRREYYLGSRGASGGVKDRRRSEFIKSYFLSQLPATQETLIERGGAYDDDYSDDDDDYGDDDDDEPSPREDEKNIKQKLLRKLATEILFHRQLYGGAAIVQSDLKWYGTCLSHSTIFAVMRFVGFSEDWISFFKKYLESPLNMDQASENRDQKGPRTRRCGVPVAHASEKFLGELVLFFMDMAVNQETGMLLYRQHDDLWLCGEPAPCAHAWEVIQEFAQVTGLTINYEKTGSVYLSSVKDAGIVSRLPRGPVKFGFLTLDSESGDWVIDQTQVDAHVQQLQMQLKNCDNVAISWIRTWNSCIGRFFKSTFGLPANCFGGPHVDSILASYEKMNKTLFKNPDAPTVTDHLRQMIRSRFELSNIDTIPDAFFFLPEKLGGLALRNPFIAILLIRDGIQFKPTKFLDDFKKREFERYLSDQEDFNNMTDRSLNYRLQNVNEAGKPPLIPHSEQRTFMSFDEWSKFRETSSYDLRNCYVKLLGVPTEQRVKLTQATEAALTRARKVVDLGNLDEEEKWILQLYSEDLIRDFGGLSIVDKKFLPLGLLAMIREKRVKWQMVL
ncbi:uncharacterized protein ASPGLDRAFT_157245 [Aspergillus glaucus CBS 516.65]|uniref:Reverse transcriptase domain-containing protein n=1 Tax=Aspergillus glaucus CBS 516.65 TaxID=1160497 RepID=A0A1L9V907_ASPGL|nr:hypothetical protein ASPGLDRAFT_157245 [Aspergillus glaucus CBS 516.65]OJJ80355.1 hypothetical protein ASPGLDRAFT_157245 [Aspergillus glaucus CBS 516.65]